MMKRPLLLCTSIAALALLDGTANAQSERGSPGAGGPTMERGASPETTAPQGKMEKGTGDKMMDKGASPSDQPSRRSDKPEARDQSSGSKKMDDTAKSDDKRGKDRRDSADTGRTDSDAATSGRSEGAEGKGGDSKGSMTQLSGEKRTKVQSVFRAHKSEAVVKDLDISINVGVNVPRSITLYVVPEEVVVIVPEYRRYKYFIFGDKVVIVDPDTFVIIDVLILA